jgi:hypothetical protein
MAAGTADERERLLASGTLSGDRVTAASASYEPSYGAISRAESSSTLEAAEEPGKPDGSADKVSRKFSEIWAVCLGLSTA